MPDENATAPTTAREALQELVALDDLKDSCVIKHGSMAGSWHHSTSAQHDDYQRRKPLAWKAARAVLAATEQQAAWADLPLMKRCLDTLNWCWHKSGHVQSSAEVHALILELDAALAQVKEPAPAAGHTPEPVAWMTPSKIPGAPPYPQIVSDEWKRENLAEYEWVKDYTLPLYTSPNVPAPQAQGAGEVAVRAIEQDFPGAFGSDPAMACAAASCAASGIPLAPPEDYHAKAHRLARELADHLAVRPA